jgi:ankyrin repeat protein
VELLLSGCADVNFRTFNSTPLHEAIESGNLDIARLLLDLVVDVNARDKKGACPLHKASRS